MKDLPVFLKNDYLIDQQIKVVYPQIYQFHHTIIEEKVNRRIKETVNQQIINQGIKDTTIMDMTGTYEIKTNERGVFSLTLMNYAYTGGAHGMTRQNALTFDMRTGESISLKDLFIKGEDYQEVLSDIVLKQIKERDIYVLGEYQGITKNQDYYIADKSLVLFFQLYALTPYVYGFPYFPISVYEIQFMVKETSILGRMLG